MENFDKCIHFESKYVNPVVHILRPDIFIVMIYVYIYIFLFNLSQIYFLKLLDFVTLIFSKKNIYIYIYILATCKQPDVLYPVDPDLE